MVHWVGMGGHYSLLPTVLARNTADVDLLSRAYVKVWKSGLTALYGHDFITFHFNFL